MGLINNNWAEQPWCQYAWCGPTAYDAINSEVVMVTPGTKVIPCQVRLVAYNVDKIRVLWEIKSDGTESSNYTASSEASADKGVINLKSDIIEKYWQTDTSEDEWCQFDAGDGRTISLDTFALIAHNLSGSASVVLKGYGGSGDAAPGDWSAVAVYATLTMPEDPDEDKLIYIAPTLPANSYRHWRVEIDDPQNPDGFIRVGRLVAGSALIFNGENCLADIDLTDVPFNNEMKLNGFTGITNARALKRLMKVRFRDLDRVNRSNYRLLKRYIRYCRTSLKALVIVDPSDEATKYQFTAYAKLREAVQESHRFNASDSATVAFELIYDEAK